MSFLLYLVGSVVFVSGLAWIATVAGVSQAFVIPTAAVLLGLGVLTAVARRRTLIR